MAREDPQFRVRLPAELKSHVEAAAEKAGRSINSEIIHRLDSYDSLLREVQEQAAYGVTTTAELDAARAELEAVKRALDEATHRAGVLDEMYEMLEMLVRDASSLTKDQAEILDEFAAIAQFLSNDAYLLEDNSVHPFRIRVPGPKTPETYLGRDLASAVDRRVVALMRHALSLPAKHAHVLLRAMAVVHSVLASETERELADLLLEAPADAAAFSEYVEAMMDDMPEDRQAEYRTALGSIMRRVYGQKQEQPRPRDRPGP